MRISVYKDMLYQASFPGFAIERKMKRSGMKTPLDRCKSFLSNYDSARGGFSLFRLSDEFSWMENGKNLICIDNDVCDQIIKFKNPNPLSNQSAKSPVESFILAIPEDLMVDNVKIPSPLVTYRRYNKGRDKLLGKFVSTYDLKTPLAINERSLNYDQFLITIMFRSSGIHGQILSVILPEKHIQYIANSDNYQEYSRNMELTKEEGTADIFIANGGSLSGEEAKVQFSLVKLVSNFLLMHAGGMIKYETAKGKINKVDYAQPHHYYTQFIAELETTR